ncbi:hypothetical protein ACIRYZ_27100 [Kitasatospora sp. NPDC101155]|uniref:hypothetical protein n=1 Tax=Kitasatospora sp. NPDC101155 TaxID=3364097 RepID=UPI00380F7BFB
MTKRGTKDGRGHRKAVAVVTAAGMLALGAVGYDAVVELQDAWAGRPYPVADPAAVAKHLDARTQTVYGALALPPGAALDREPWAGDGITARVYDVCRPRGISHLLENMSDRGADEPRTATLDAGFILTGITPPQAQEALRRARQTLTGQGWTETAADDTRVTLKPPSTGPGSLAETVTVGFSPERGTLAVAAGTECARYPDDTPVDWDGKPTDLPSPTAPAQLRSH